MELFRRPRGEHEPGAINIPPCWTGVRALARQRRGGRRGAKEVFDPSLPPTLGDEDQLIQVFPEPGEERCGGGDGPGRWCAAN
jgi:nitrogen-specific signal transduction histidine kinase